MGFINLAEKTIHAKLVYYGVGAGGKTTSLQAVHGIMCPSNEVKLVSIKTEQDATLLFDFLPINLGTVEGYQIVIQGFTVPGQPKYKRMRKYVLQGADAVVLVVDSQASRLQENVEALESMLENLRSNGIDPDKIPIVIQYNKRDLDDILSEEEMNPHFLIRDDVAAFPSVATDDQGVYETFVHCAGQLVEEKIRQYDLGKGEVNPLDVADAARTKLWQIFDVWREQQEDAATRDEVLQFHVDEESGAGAEAIRDDEGQIDLVETRPEEAMAEVPEDVPEETSAELTDALPIPELTLDDEPAPIEVEAEPKPQSAIEAELEETIDDWLAEADGPLDAPEPEAPTIAEELDQALPEDDPPELASDEIFSDDDLDIDLDEVIADAVPSTASGEMPSEEGEAGLLDMALQSNLQMAEAFGELDQFKAKLRRKNEELVKITQNTIHDLNKPLGAIKLMLTSVTKGYFGATEGRVASAIENSMAAVEMMERLMGDLMDSMVLDTSFQMKFAEVDLGILISGVLRTLRYNIEENGVGVRVEPMPKIVADEWALTKAFMNLIGNAIQYRDPERPSRIHVSYEDHGDMHRVLVADNGLGVPEEDQEGLFLRFERGSNVAGISGTGLGLHIVKEAVLGHGGLISLTSAIGQGTTFTLDLPKQPVHVPQSEVTETVSV